VCIVWVCGEPSAWLLIILVDPGGFLDIYIAPQLSLLKLSSFLFILYISSAMAANMEKSTAAHQDAIEQFTYDSNSNSDESGDQAIIHELETHGEEIGMTWRTILAAAVSEPQLYSDHLLIKAVYGDVLQRISFYPVDSTSDPRIHQRRTWSRY
jgi:hypothetical protein